MTHADKISAAPDERSSEWELEIDGLFKEFLEPSTGGAHLVLEGIDLKVKKGELITIVGPSGCGKSTLLKIIAGFEEPTAGSIRLEGRPITGSGPDQIMVFQDYALFPWMNTVENVEFGLRIQRLNGELRREKAMEALGRVSLQHVSDRPVYQLSGGMQQRVAIARALVMQPKILLMDEPFGAVDAQQRHLLQQELMRIWRDTGQTILFVTHSLDEAIFLSSSVLLMAINPGRFIHSEEISLARPRDTTSESFNQIERRLRQLLDAEVQKSEDQLGQSIAEAPPQQRRWKRRQKSVT